MSCTRSDALIRPFGTYAARGGAIALVAALVAAGLVTGACGTEAPVPVQTVPPTAPAVEPAEQPAGTAPAKTVTKPPGAERAKPAPKPPQKKSKTAAVAEFEVSAYTSEIADHMNGRVNLSRSEPTRRAWLRTGYGLSKSRSFSRANVIETELGTLNVDLGLRRGGPKSYHFVQAVASVRTRRPNVRGYPDRAGYSTVSAGFGRNLFSALDCELALAHVTRVTKEGTTERLLTPVYTFGLKAPVSGSAVLDGDLRLVEPFADDPLVDLRLNLTYRLTPAMSLRFTYLANNLLNNLLIPISSRPNTEWDKSFRISLVFGRR